MEADWEHLMKSLQFLLIDGCVRPKMVDYSEGGTLGNDVHQERRG